ncbi:MAG TPA: hypothetical protein DDY98_03925 [Ruminococcaceae bacterium]|nr:hypothetical protein [Oscillospiraceae bacterium]
MKPSSTILKQGTFMQRKYKKLLIAGILMWMVTLVDSCADTFLAGIFINENAVSGVELVSPYFSILSFVAYIISMGTALLYSRESGAFRHERAYGIVGQGIICAAGASVILVIAMIVLREPLMNFYSSSAEVTAYANEYYTYQLFFALMYPMFYLLSELVIIDGDEIVPAVATVTMAAVNMGASLLFVKSHGVKGLALGTVVGAACGLLVYCTHFLRKTNSIRVRLHFSVMDVSEMAKLSSSTAVTLLYVAIIDIIMNKYVISRFTDAYLPAYAVINFVLNLGEVCSSTFDAASGFISVGFGEKNPASIKRVMKIATVSVIIESLAALVILQFVAPAISTFYGITDPQVAVAAAHAARITAISFPAIGLYYLYCAYYPAVEYVLLGNITTVVYMLITPLAVAMPLGNAFGFEGLTWGFALTAVIAILVTVLIIRIKYGKKAVPLALRDTDEESLLYDISLSPESIITLIDRVRSDLSERGVSAHVLNEVSLVLEESYMTILAENPKKKTLSECNILLSDKSLRLITRDNGRIFDITDANAKIKDLRSYVLACLMERNPKRSHVTTISFNRNCYVWDFETNE